MINPDELIFCVDQDNNPIEPQLKTYAHEHGIWHRNSHIWVHDGQGKILCHQRSALVPTNALRWEPFFGGHNAPHATPLDTAVTELREEIGLEVSGANLNFMQLEKYLHGHEFISVYGYKFLGKLEDLRIEKEEVLSVKWYDAETLRKVYASEDPAWSHLGYEMSLLAAIELL